MRFRNAVCPWCKHEFTALPNQEYTGYEFFDRITKEQADTTICPKCGRQMVLIPNKAEGIDPENDRYEKQSIRAV